MTNINKECKIEIEIRFRFDCGDEMKQVNYNTKQKATIMNCIKTMGDAHFTIDSLCAEMLKAGDAIGRTTVYRLVEKLSNDGVLRKYAATAGESACYQYVGENSSCHEHFHLKCEKCAKLIHMDCHEMHELAEHIKSHHGFSMNPFKTVIYGLCEGCSKK